MTRLMLALAVVLATATEVGATPRTTALDVPGVRAYQRPEDGALLTGIVVSVDAGLDRERSREDGLAALVAEVLLRSPVARSDGARTPLVDAVDASGASLTYEVLPRQLRFYLEGTPSGVSAAAQLMAAALQAPAFDAGTLNAARAALADRIKDEESDPRYVGRAMLRASFYRGSAGRAPFGSAATLAQFGPDDARSFFAQWYRRGGAVIAAVGRTDDATQRAVGTLGAALPAGPAAAPATIVAKAFGAQAKRIVTQRDVGAPYVTLGFAAPAFGERDFAPALVVRALLDTVFDRTSSATLPTVFRSIGALYDYDTAPSQFVLWINGAQIDPEVGLAAIDAVVKGAAAKRLNPATLARYKDSARGEWILQTLRLDQRAAAIERAVTRGLDPDTADATAAAIARVTAADVQRVVKRYFQRYDVALVLPRTSGR